MPLTSKHYTDLSRVAERMANEMSEQQLLREIGLRARTFALYPAAAASTGRSVPEAVALERAWDDLDEFGGWIFRRLHRRLDGRRAEADATADGIVSDLTAARGVAPGIASVVTALVLKRQSNPGWAETCAPGRRASGPR